MQAASLAAAACACSDMEQAASSQDLWQRLYCKELGVSDQLVSSSVFLSKPTGRASLFLVLFSEALMFCCCGHMYSSSIIWQLVVQDNHAIVGCLLNKGARWHRKAWSHQSRPCTGGPGQDWLHCKPQLAGLLHKATFTHQ